MVVVNMTRDKMWVRNGVVPSYPSIAPPQFDLAPDQGLVVPAPRQTRANLQQQSIRDAEINPDLYYPTGKRPVLIEDWPTNKAIYLPNKLVPPAMRHTVPPTPAPAKPLEGPQPQ